MDHARQPIRSGVTLNLCYKSKCIYHTSARSSLSLRSTFALLYEALAPELGLERLFSSSFKRLSWGKKNKTFTSIYTKTLDICNFYIRKMAKSIDAAIWRPAGLTSLIAFSFAIASSWIFPFKWSTSAFSSSIVSTKHSFELEFKMLQLKVIVSGNIWYRFSQEMLTELSNAFYHFHMISELLLRVQTSKGILRFVTYSFSPSYTI